MSEFYMNRKEKIFYFVSFMLILVGEIDYLINIPRKIYTAKILGLPHWTYLHYLSLEHLLGFTAVCLLYFLLVYIGIGLLYLITLFTSVLTREKFSFNVSSKIPIVITTIMALVTSAIYEIIVQKLSTAWQIPLDFIGVFIYWRYINYVFS